MVSTKDNKGSPVHISPPQIRVTTDSLLIGWGAVCNDIQTGGQWGLSEIPTDNNINYLKLKALYLGLLSFREELLNKHVRIQTDNSTTITYINHMGRHALTAVIQLPESSGNLQNSVTCG